jgi:hypothetical protein
MNLQLSIAAVALLGLAALGGAGCSAPIHIGQPVEVPAKGEIQVALGSGVSGSSAAYDLVTAANDKAKELATKQYNCKASDKSDCLPSLQLREMVRGTYAMGLAGTVDVNMEGGGLYGLGHGLAIGGRLSRRQPVARIAAPGLQPHQRQGAVGHPGCPGIPQDS